MHNNLHSLVWLNDKIDQPLCSLSPNYALHSVTGQISILNGDLVASFVNDFLDVNI